MEISVELSRASIERAASELMDYAREVEDKADIVARDVSYYGCDQAMGYAPVDIGNLKTEIDVAMGDGCYKVVADVDVNGKKYAPFVEFGTGVAGMGTYPGQLPAGYRHDTRQGEGWVYKDDVDDKWHYTEGHSAQPFMAPAAEDMRQYVWESARKVFG